MRELLVLLASLALLSGLLPRAEPSTASEEGKEEEEKGKRSISLNLGVAGATVPHRLHGRPERCNTQPESESAPRSVAKC